MDCHLCSVLINHSLLILYSHFQRLERIKTKQKDKIRKRSSKLEIIRFEKKKKFIVKRDDDSVISLWIVF